ncbi:hypothetical protein [Candidatus Endomicrobiellum trichonymphae]|uniref:hypothetical protein n=1 Tax=Endomicrobium trichonymphae TaxID=1408204 RepID=UPI000325D0A2|nr:hypothetical protein [Candidatus Endomicrobium trichonymphae]
MATSCWINKRIEKGELLIKKDNLDFKVRDLEFIVGRPNYVFRRKKSRGRERANRA